MAKTEHITQERLHSILDYDEHTGLFTWKISKPGISKGKIAGTIDQDGYIAITIDRVQHRAHRLVWLYVYGFLPEEIDHIDVHGPRTDNRLCNLRAATNSENKRNRGLSKRNTSGFKGVYFEADRGKFRASIKKDGKTIHLGRYNNAEEAHAAYWEAAEILHGEFARAS